MVLCLAIQSCLTLWDTVGCSLLGSSVHWCSPVWKPKNTVVSSLSLLQGIFPTQKLNQGLLLWKWILYKLSTRRMVRFSSVTQLCPTLCDPMNRSTPGLPAHHKLPEFTQTHAHRVSDAIQPSHPVSSPSPPAPNPSQNQGLFQQLNSLHKVAKVLEFQLQHQSFQWTPRTYLHQDGLVGSPWSPRDSQESSPTPEFKSINFSAFSFLHSRMVGISKWHLFSCMRNKFSKSS